MPPYDWANGGSVDVFELMMVLLTFWGMASMALILQENRKFTILELKSKPTSSLPGNNLRPLSCAFSLLPIGPLEHVHLEVSKTLYQ